MNYMLLESNKASTGSIAKRKPIVAGFINDADFNVSIKLNGRRLQHEGYQTWIHMIHRCFGASVTKYPTYSGVTVCEKWRNFSRFNEWWKLNQVPGWCLDKDALGDGSIYSPDTCIYIPQKLNKFLNVCAAKRGDNPLGVTLFRNKFRAMVSDPIAEIHVWIGDFDTAEEAHAEWWRYKMGIVERLKSTLDEIDGRLYPKIKLKIAALL